MLFVLGTASQNVILTNSTVVTADDGAKLQIDGATGHSLRSLLNAYGNTAMGYGAGITVATGARNTLICAGAGANLATNTDNTIVGATAMRNPDMTVTTGIGPIGNFNTMLGYNAGGNNGLGGVWTISSTYTNVIMVGNSTGKETLGGTLTNTTLIGHNLITNLSNILVLGNAGQSVILPNTDTVTVDSGAKLQINAAQATSSCRSANHILPHPRPMPMAEPVPSPGMRIISISKRLPDGCVLPYLPFNNHVPLFTIQCKNSIFP